jgi:hypothetical protein
MVSSVKEVPGSHNLRLGYHMKHREAPGSMKSLRWWCYPSGDLPEPRRWPTPGCTAQPVAGRDRSYAPPDHRLAYSWRAFADQRYPRFVIEASAARRSGATGAAACACLSTAGDRGPDEPEGGCVYLPLRDQHRLAVNVLKWSLPCCPTWSMRA